MRKIVRYSCALLFGLATAAAQSVSGGGGALICSLSGSPTSGYVLTAGSGGSCSWQTVGAASVDNNTVKSAIYLTNTGTANAITGTTTTAFPAAYAAGQAIIFKAAATNTGPVTITVNTLATVAATKNGATALAAGNLVSGQFYLAAYDGTEFQILDYTPIAGDITPFTLTTTGTSGAATYSGGVLNIPQYATTGGTLNIDVGGSLIGTQPTLNFISGTGITQTCANNAGTSSVDCTPAINTAVIPTHDQIHGPELVAALTSSGTCTFTASFSATKTITAYTDGMVFSFKPDTTCSSGPTLNIDSVATDGLKEADGTTNLTTTLGQTYIMTYDSTLGVFKEFSSPYPVANTTVTVATSTTINANTCTAQTNITMTGLTTSMTANFTAASDTSAVTGWGSPSSAVLYITDYPAAGALHWSICNGTSSNITTSGAVTFNVSAR